MNHLYVTHYTCGTQLLHLRWEKNGMASVIQWFNDVVAYLNRFFVLVLQCEWHDFQLTINGISNCLRLYFSCKNLLFNIYECNHSNDVRYDEIDLADGHLARLFQFHRFRISINLELWKRKLKISYSHVSDCAYSGASTNTLMQNVCSPQPKIAIRRNGLRLDFD